MTSRIGLIDRDGRERIVEYRWNRYQVPREVRVGGVEYRRVEERSGQPWYREVADGYLSPPTDVLYSIMDSAGRERHRGALQGTGIPMLLPYLGRTATLVTISGPGGRVVYTLDTDG